MEGKEICKICGKEYKKMTTMHLSTHGVNMEQYNLMPEYSELEDIDVEPTGNTKVTQKEINDKIWGNQKKDTSRPLQDFLNEFMLTEEEARSVLKKFTKGERIDPRIQAENFDKIGSEGAMELKDRDRVETQSLHVAEKLVEKHGFICEKIIGKKGNTQKTWVLIKT